MRGRWMSGLTAAAATASLVLAGCGGDGDDDGGGGGGDETLVVWTMEDVEERVQAQQAILDAYTKETGVKTELVALAEDQLATTLSTAAADGDLPDVIGAVSLNGINLLDTEGVLDTDVAAEVVDTLGADTFSTQALELLKTDDTQLAVPSDGWAQMLFYRTDMFDDAGLEPPTTFDAITTAAETLNKGEIAGIVAATAPADSFTQQTFEHAAVANGCQLTDDEGNVTLDSPNCAETFDFYANLIKSGSVAGNQDADTTRATYFAGNAAMIWWSSFLLDELAGLRNDALPTCPECEGDPKFLADNTGVVSAIEGPSGSEPASFGEIVSWAITTDASDSAAEFVEYMMNDGYIDWLSVAPEGKVPTRLGTSDEPTTYSDQWRELKAGVERKAVLSSVFSQETLDAVAAAPEGFDRWGIPQGEGSLAAAVAAQFVVPKAIAEMLDSGTSGAEAAEQVQSEVEGIQSDLG